VNGTRVLSREEATGAGRPKVTPSGLLEAAAWVAVLATMLGFANGQGWFPELASHFRAQYAVVLGVAATTFAFRRSWLRTAVFAAGLAGNALLILPLYLPFSRGDRSSDAGGSELTVLLANLHADNDTFEPFLEYVREAAPDVIAAMEVTPDWDRALDDIRRDYPYGTVQTRTDNFGVAVLSKKPLSGLAVKHFGDAYLPSVVGTYRTASGPVTLVLTHPLPPATPEFLALRNGQLDEVADAVSRHGRCLIVMGDLNMTSWSDQFQEFLARTGLRDTRKGFGVQPTWPTWLPPMLITLDHVLAGDCIETMERETGPDIGSDHYPVKVRFRVDEAQGESLVLDDTTSHRQPRGSP